MTGAHPKTRKYYKPSALHKVLEEKTIGRQNHAKLLWVLLNLTLWQREYGT